MSLKIFDVTSRLVRTLVDEVQDPGSGEFEVFWDGRNNAGERVNSGTYFYQLETPGFRSAKKAVVLK